MWIKYTGVKLKYYEEDTVNLYDAFQRGIRGRIASEKQIK